MLGANPGGWVFTQSPDIGLNRAGPLEAASMGNNLWGLRTKGQDPSTWAWEWREVLGNGVQEVELVRSFYPIRQSFLGNILAQVKIAFFPSRTSGLLRSWITHTRTHLGPGTLPPTPGGLFPVPSTALISELVPRAKRRDPGLMPTSHISWKWVCPPHCQRRGLGSQSQGSLTPRD